MKRRQLLVTGTAGLTTVLSGCGALGGDGDGSATDTPADGNESRDTATATATETPTGPAEFEEVTLSAPDGVTIDSEFSLTVTATNVGGETGSYEGTVQMAAESQESSTESGETTSFETSFTIEDVAPGETGETEITVPAFATVDDYEFSLVDADASTTVRPDAETVAVGETLTVGEDLAVTVDDVAVQESVFYPTSRSSGLSTYDEVASFGAPSGHVLAVVTVTAENTGTETTSAGRGTIGINGAEWYGDGEGTPRALLGRADSRFYDGGLPDIAPSESATGYYLAKVPRETARGTIEVTGQVDGTGTLPERVWAAEPDGDERALPDLTLQSVETPDTTALGRDYEFTVTVANEGDAAGMVRSVVQWDADGTWAQLTTADSRTDLDVDRGTGGVISSQLEAGASTEITLSSFSAYNSQYTYRIQPFGDEWQTDFQAAQLSMGERLKSTANTNLVVSDLRTQDTVTAYDDWDEELFEAQPDDGNQFVAVQFRFAQRVEGGYASAPSIGSFEIVADGTTVGTSSHVADDIREDWYEPIEGSLEEQPELTGWGFYEVPESYAASDLSVKYEESAGFGSSAATVATWSQ